MKVLHAAFPTLTSRGAYHNIQEEVDFGTWKGVVVPFLSLVKRSSVVHLKIHELAPSSAPALIEVLQTCRLQSLSMVRFSSSALTYEQLIPLMEAISTLPPERSLTSLGVSVDCPAEARAVLPLADSTATHTLRCIRVYCFALGFDFREADVEDSIFQLLTIPTLRALILEDHHWIFLSHPHISILRDCIRARAQSGAPSLDALAFENTTGPCPPWRTSSLF